MGRGHARPFLQPMSFSIPGYAVLTRVVFDTPLPEGIGFFCALAVPAKDEAMAHDVACEYFASEPCSVSVIDTRVLSPEESGDLAGVRPLGDRVFFHDDKR